MSSWKEFAKEVEKSEGRIPHMYLDTKGKVTVGIGNMIPHIAAAQKLPFVDRGTKKRATAAEIKADFETVRKQPKGKLAKKYEAMTKLILTEIEIDKLFNKRIAEFKTQIKHKFPDFEKYPLSVQFALMDMAFNLGTAGLVQKFPNFTKAVKANDWKKAAAQSNRPHLNSIRNKTVKDWLLKAQKAN